MVIELEQTRLEQRIRDAQDPAGRRRPSQDTLGDRLKQVEREARPVLENTKMFAPFFTDHGEPHARGVIEALNRLIPKSMYPGGTSEKALHPYEVFLLLAAAWLHDTGMVEGSNWLEQAKQPGHREGQPTDCNDLHCPLLSGLPRNDKEERHVIRRCHHCFSMWAINGALGQRAGLTDIERVLVGRLARAHNYHANINDVGEVMNVATGVQVRQRFLASLLRLADAMDYSRIPNVNPNLFRRDREAQLHCDLHHLVTDVDPDLPNGTIKVHIMAASEQDAAIVKRYRVRELQEELDSVMPVLAKQGIHYFDGVTAQTTIQPEFDHPIQLKEPPAKGRQLPHGWSRIIVIDDDEGPRRVLRDLVKQLGNVVVDTAGSCAEAEEYLASRFYHAAVIDVGLEPRDYDQQPSLEHATGLFLLQHAPHPNRAVPTVLVSSLPWTPAVLAVLVALAGEVGAAFLEKDLSNRQRFRQALLNQVKNALAQNYVGC
jgi:CheY-like chemotaxis protein